MKANRDKVRPSEALTDASTARIQTLLVEQLEGLAEALLDFTCPVDLAAWLADHTG